MRSSIPTIFIVSYVYLVSAETESFISDIGAGKGKITCTFNMVYQGTLVNIQRSSAMYSKPKKTKNVKNLKITSSSSGNIYTITMTAKKGSTKGILKKVDVELATKTTTTTTTEQPVPNKVCELGYSAVCTSTLVEIHDEDDMRSVCPATHSANGKEDEEEVCSCLPTRAVEQDVAEGMSPLGSQHKECVKFPANLLPGDDLDVGNITTMMDDWSITGAVQGMTENAGEQEELMSTLKKAMKKEMKHSKVLQKNISTKFIRSTATSQKISENYRMMKCLQNATKSVTSSWATSRQSSGQQFQDSCLALTSLLSPCPSTCDGTETYRSIDGCCNNLNIGELGSAHKALVRFLDPVYADNIEVPRGGLSPSSLPNARDVSRAVHRTKQVVGNKGASLMVMQFGQFLDHDITLTPEPDSECCDDSLELDVCFNIDSAMDKFFMGMTNCLPFSRSDAICSQTGRREQINALTAFIDGSNVYGSDRNIAEGLRTIEGGELRVHELGPTMPTRKDAGFDSVHGQHPKDLVAGDMRAIEQPGLASMHSLFLNEHNRIVRILKEKSPDLVDEDLYQIARKIVGAELQNIVYSEFLPVVLGEQGMIEFNLKLPEEVSGESVYDPSVDPTIRNEFATAAFRFGHSLIPNHFLPELSPIRTKYNSCPVKDNFFKFEEFILGSDFSGKAWQNMIRGIINQESPSMDISLNKNVLDFLFCENNCDIPEGLGQDLAARNIQRGRDHGLQPYTKYREFCKLPALIDWKNKPAEISQQDWDNFQKVYSSVEDIDLFVGGLAEVASGDGLVGPTFGCIIGQQFELLKKGDRFFFTHKSSGTQNEKGLPVDTRISIRSRTLGDIICDNTDASGTATNVMKISSNNEAISCSSREGLDFDAIVEDFTATPLQGILISGGTSDSVEQNDLELFVPSTETSRSCRLMPLPSSRSRHTLDIIKNNPVICGGGTTPKSCIRFYNGKWSDYYIPLIYGRNEPTSWVSRNGLVLMGGWHSPSTTEILPGDDFSREEFNLKYTAIATCAITDLDSTILTGGSQTSKRVTRYNLEQGFVEDLPALKTPRMRHGCGSYRQGGGALVLIVAGGYVPPDGPNSPAGPSHDSTEQMVMLPGTEWTEASPLPRKIFNMASVSLNNKVYLVGGIAQEIGDGIFEFDGNDWKMVGNLSKRREFPGIAKVDVNKLDFCQ